MANDDGCSTGSKGQIVIKEITSSNTKFDYLVSSLPSEMMEIVADILMTPPADDKYKGLKLALIKRCSDSEEKCLDSLLNKADLGDLKPSELYRQMKTLTGDNSLVNENLLNKLWRNRLPPALQSLVIAIESTHTQEQIFTVADKIHVATDRPRVAAIKTNFDDSELSKI